MKNKVFLDTGGLVALINQDEVENHELAVKVFENCKNNGYSLFTTDQVLNELVTWLRCRKKISIEAVFEFLHYLYVQDLNVIEVGHRRFGAAMILAHKFRDHSFSLTDCASFVVMREFGVKGVLTTDRHFEIAGFQNLLVK